MLQNANQTPQFSEFKNELNNSEKQGVGLSSNVGEI